jgi:hypothetical protein
VWAVVLNLPPGSTTITASYRLNFLHGLISSIVALMCLSNQLDENFTAMCSVSYFVVDFINILINDFIWKVSSYQTGSARKMEYFHHILCGGCGVFCQLYYKEMCVLDRNPFIQFMLAELSTPLLIIWRNYPSKMLLTVFAVVFFAVRIVFHSGVFIPSCVKVCGLNSKPIYYGMWFFSIFYTLMNVFFIYMIVRKILKPDNKSKKFE